MTCNLLCAHQLLKIYSSPRGACTTAAGGEQHVCGGALQLHLPAVQVSTPSLGYVNGGWGWLHSSPSVCYQTALSKLSRSQSTVAACKPQPETDGLLVGACCSEWCGRALVPRFDMLGILRQALENRGVVAPESLWAVLAGDIPFKLWVSCYVAAVGQACRCSCPCKSWQRAF